MKYHFNFTLQSSEENIKVVCDNERTSRLTYESFVNKKMVAALRKPVLRSIDITLTAE